MTSSTRDGGGLCPSAGLRPACHSSLCECPSSITSVSAWAQTHCVAKYGGAIPGRVFLRACGSPRALRVVTRLLLGFSESCASENSEKLRLTEKVCRCATVMLTTEPEQGPGESYCSRARRSWSFLSPAVGGGPCSRAQMSDLSQRCVQGGGRSTVPGVRSPGLSSALLQCSQPAPVPRRLPSRSAGSGPSSFGRLREGPSPSLYLVSPPEK